MTPETITCVVAALIVGGLFIFGPVRRFVERKLSERVYDDFVGEHMSHEKDDQ